MKIIPRTSPRAFILIELLAVIPIIAAAALLPSALAQTRRSGPDL